jgi:hypothetical protein
MNILRDSRTASEVFQAFANPGRTDKASLVNQWNVPGTVKGGDVGIEIWDIAKEVKAF